MNRLDSARAALLAAETRTAYADAVADAFDRDLGDAPASYTAVDVRVLCPRGHFIADVTVLAADTWHGVTLLPEPLSESDSAPWGLAYEQPRTWVTGDLDKLLHGRIRAVCKRSKCTYRGSFSTDSLIAELVDTAARGEAEHRFIN